MSVAGLAESARPVVGHRAHTLVTTPLGDMLAVADDAGILLCDFTDRPSLGRTIDRLPRVSPGPAADAFLLRLKDELSAYFAGRLTRFTVPLTPLGAPFQRAAWRQLLDVPYGQTASYARQAVGVGNPKAVRAVAAANGQNARCVLIPCHRVIGSDGTLVGYGAGIERKRWLLDHERKHAAADGRADVASQSPGPS